MCDIFTHIKPLSKRDWHAAIAAFSFCPRIFLRNFKFHCPFCLVSLATNWEGITSAQFDTKLIFVPLTYQKYIEWPPENHREQNEKEVTAAFEVRFSGEQTVSKFGTKGSPKGCLSLLASIGFVMTNPLARVSITLGKHRFWTPKLDLPPCLSVEASIGFGYPNPSCRLSVTLSKHRVSVPNARLLGWPLKPLYFKSQRRKRR